MVGGIGVIDGYLTEINVTSPTAIRAVKTLGGPNVTAMIWDKIEAKAGSTLQEGKLRIVRRRRLP